MKEYLSAKKFLAARLTVVVACILIPSKTFALTGSNHVAGFGLSSTQYDDSHIESIEIKPDSSSLGLHDSDTRRSLLGRYRVTPETIIAESAPHLADLRIYLSNKTKTGEDTTHETYVFYYGNFRVEGAELRIHNHKNILVFLRSELPDFRLNSSEPTVDEFLPLSEFGYSLNTDGYTQVNEMVVVESGGFPTPAWLINRTNNESGINERIIVDAQTGAILLEETTDFGIAHVFAENSLSNILETVQLPDLYDTGYLEGPNFTVYAPTESDPRVFSEHNIYQFNPNSSSQSHDFDQVQAYYNAARVLDWFSTNHGFDMAGVQMELRVNDIIHGRGDNAIYVPPPQGPMIRIGAGQGDLTNLVRDSDVMAHEFGHHVIYNHIKSMDGQSGELHEGYADYFSYAINNDPYLAESILTGQRYLRTAEIDADQGEAVRFDDPTKEQTKYFKAQIWSALLWDLRTLIGEDFDAIAYNSLNYVGSGAGYREAIYGLLNADRDLNPSSESDAEFQIFGLNKCVIMKQIIERGYAVYTEKLDGDSCGYDLALYGTRSREYRESLEDPEVETRAFMPFNCSVVASTPLEGTKSSLIGILMSMPLALLLTARRKKRGN